MLHLNISFKRNSSNMDLLFVRSTCSVNALHKNSRVPTTAYNAYNLSFNTKEQF